MEYTRPCANLTKKSLARVQLLHNYGKKLHNLHIFRSAGIINLPYSFLNLKTVKKFHASGVYILNLCIFSSNKCTGKFSKLY